MSAEEDEETIERALAGELGRAPRDLAGRPEIARRVDGLGALARGLSATADEERTAIESARRTATAHDRRAVGEAIARARAAERAGRGPGGARLPRPFRTLIALAALLVVALLAWNALDGGRKEPAPVWLGAPTLRCVEPVGPVERYATFRWEVADGAALPAHGSFVIWVYADEDGARGREIARERVREDRWEPSAEREASLPDAIHWEVESVAPSGARSVSPPERAWRRPR